MLGSLNITLVTAVITGAVAFGAAWAWQGSRCVAKTASLERQYEQSAYEAERRAREIEHEYKDRVEQAVAQAAKREAAIRDEHSRVKPLVIRVRDAAAVRVQAARDSPAAECPDTASIIAVAFGECVERLTAVARDADQLRVEAQKLIDAWPR